MSQLPAPQKSLVDAVEAVASVLQSQPDSHQDRAWAGGAYDSDGVRVALVRTYDELCELAGRTAAERSAQGHAISPAQLILAQYHAAYRDLQAALLGLPDSVEDQAPAEGEWSLRRVVAHIVGAEIGFYVVVRYALDQHRSGDDRLAKIPDEAWEPILGHDLDSVDALLAGPLPGIRDYHAALHQRVLHDFAAITDPELAASSLYWEGYELDLRFRLHRFDSHLRQHTVQVDKTLHALGHGPTEARRILRLIYGALAEAEGAIIGAWDLAGETWFETVDAIAARGDEVAGILA